MADARSQHNYQVRLGWGERSLSQLAESDIVVVVDAIGTSGELLASATSLSHKPVVFSGSLRNATATAKAVYDEQVSRSGRATVNLVLAGDDGEFAVEDYLAAGAIADALTSLGIDHSAPDAAVATEGFRSLTRALKHLFLASASGLELKEADRRDDVHAAAELDADVEADRRA